jgi:hypothetical protein
MSDLYTTFRELIKISGKILFIIGLVLNICMLFFGFWPSIIYILIMFCGIIMVIINKDIKINYKKNVNKVISPIRNYLKSTIIIHFKYKLALKFFCFFISIIIILSTVAFFVSRQYMKRKNTINESEEIIAALNVYKLQTHAYPSHLDDIIGQNPIRKGWKKDSWGNYYIYQVNNRKNSFTLISKGQDGLLNTTDDIKNN